MPHALTVRAGEFRRLAPRESPAHHFGKRLRRLRAAHGGLLADNERGHRVNAEIGGAPLLGADRGDPHVSGEIRGRPAAREARSLGHGRQHFGIADALFAAYWARGEDVGDAEVLAAVSEAAGLSRGWAATNLAGDARVAAVRAEERRAADLGIRAVPTFVVGEQSAMSGAQPPEALTEAVRRALARS